MLMGVRGDFMNRDKFFLIEGSPRDWIVKTDMDESSVEEYYELKEDHRFNLTSIERISENEYDSSYLLKEEIRTEDLEKLEYEEGMSLVCPEGDEDG